MEAPPRSRQVVGSAPQLWEDGVLDLLPPAGSPGSLLCPVHLYAQLGEAWAWHHLEAAWVEGHWVWRIMVSLLGSAEVHLR